MGLETTIWDAADHLDSPEAIAAYLEAVFEIGEPDLIEAALGDVARALGMSIPVAAVADVPSLIRTMKALGLGLTAKAA